MSPLVQRHMTTGSFADQPHPGAVCDTARRQDVNIRQRHLRNGLLTVTTTASVVKGTWVAQHTGQQWQDVFIAIEFGEGDQPMFSC